MAAIPDTSPNAAHDLLSVRGVCELIGVAKNTVFNAVRRGRLHPIRVRGSSRFLIFKSEVLAWRHRYQWSPTPEEMAALLASGYKAEDFTPIEPATASQGASSMGALVSQSDVLAYMQAVMREGQGQIASAAPLVESAAQGAMRGWAETMGASGAPDVAALASGITEGALRPILDTIRASITPLSESLAQAALPRPAPPAEDVVARQMGVLRVELAHVLMRMLDAMRPMVERLASGGYITPEDAAPMLGLMGEIASGLAGSPLYDVAPRDLSTQLPAIVERLTVEAREKREAQAASPTPTPEATAAPDASRE